MQYGMIGFYVPHRLYPAGYHCDPTQPLTFAALASQKNHISVYLTTVYGRPGEEQWFRAAWEKTGKKLDMGKSCVRFRKLEDAALDVIGEAIRRVSLETYVEFYENSRQSSSAKGSQSAPKKKTSAKGSVKPASSKKSPGKSQKAVKKKTATNAPKKLAAKKKTPKSNR